MTTIYDYLTWRGDITFKEVLPTEIDGLILSAFSYITPITEQLTKFPYTIDKLKAETYRNANDPTLLAKMAESTRFSKVKVLDFYERIDTEDEMQFAAYCLQLCAGHIAIVYRGTDHSITGWKEDFNLGFLDQIPGQSYAANYLAKMAEAHKGKIHIFGHSKGGNLAVFAATTCDESIASRIASVYNYDGPGFSQEFIKRPAYTAMVDRIHTFLPESSIVGLFFEHEEPYEVVESKNVGITQHEPYSWIVLGSQITRAKNRSSSSYVLDHAIREWMASMNAEKRKLFVEALFSLISETDVNSIDDLMQPKNVLLAGKQYKAFSEEEREMITEARTLFAKALSDGMKKNKSYKKESKKQESKKTKATKSRRSGKPQS